MSICDTACRKVDPNGTVIGCTVNFKGCCHDIIPEPTQTVEEALPTALSSEVLESKLTTAERRKEGLLDETEDPNLVKMIGSGRFAGVIVSEIPLKNIQWMIANLNLRANVRSAMEEFVRDAGLKK